MSPGGTHAVSSPLQGTVILVAVAPGDVVAAGATLVVIESMKMEHPVVAAEDGRVETIAVAAGATVAVGTALVTLTPVAAGADAEAVTEEDRPGELRTELLAVLERRAAGRDPARPEAVAARRAQGRRTAREQVEAVCDPGSFVEYGPLVVAAQRRRRSLDELVARTPADGLVAGIGRVDGRACAVLAYDFTVLAGTQGLQNHRKKDRLFEVAAQRGLPVVLFAEGGGGRPGDTDGPGVSGLDTLAFHLFARLKGSVPLVGIAGGRCFAGNAALLGCCDVVIASPGTNIGMGGPAMIEGGGLGTVTADDIGPLDVQVANGVVDVVATDDEDAARLARRYLSYFGGPGPKPDPGERPDQELLRDVVPRSRVRSYAVREVVDLLADRDSVLELRAGFAPAMRTALARIDGRPVGILANDPSHLGGAIDADGADKGARFLQSCDAFGLPVLFLCDTPGIMVGPAAEETALVRHVSRLFVAGANLSVPYGTIVLRKGYGLGAQAMAGGSFKAPRFTVAWPTAELGGMNLEGGVKLGFRRELAAIDDEQEREETYAAMVAAAYERGGAVNVASLFEVDDVIDPAESQRWIVAGLFDDPPTTVPRTRHRPHLDTW